MPKEKIFIPFVGSTYFRETDVSSVYSRDQYFENVLLEKTENPMTGKESYFLSQRPGFNSEVVSGVVGANATRAIIWNNAVTSKNKLVNVGYDSGAGHKISIESLGIYTAGGGFSSDYFFPTYLKETYVGSTPAILVGYSKENSIRDSEWAYHIEGSGTFDKIVDAQFPATNTGEIVYFGGYHFIMGQDGRVYNSELNSIVNWPGDYISCFADPDQGVGLATVGDELLAIGTNTIEKFRLSQSPVGSPLEKIIGMTIPLGASNLLRYISQGVTYLKHQDTLFFIAVPGGSQGNRPGIFKYDGSLSKVSSPELDKALFDSIDDSRFLSAGLLGVVFLRGSLHLVGYCLDRSKLFFINLDLNNFTTFGSFSTTSTKTPLTLWFQDNNKIIFPYGKDNDGGFTGYITQNFSNDAAVGGSFTAVVQTGKIDFGTSRYKTFHQLRLVGEDPRSAGNSNWSVSWSDDDGATFSTARTINQANLNQWISGLGASRRRMFKFSFTADGTQVASRVEGFELEYTIHNS